jgi:hypothetical protein
LNCELREVGRNRAENEWPELNLSDDLADAECNTPKTVKVQKNYKQKIFDDEICYFAISKVRPNLALKSPK